MQKKLFYLKFSISYFFIALFEKSNEEQSETHQSSPDLSNQGLNKYFFFNISKFSRNTKCNL